MIRGFIQIPLLIAIIVGIAVMGGGGYFAVNVIVDQKVAKIQEELSQKQTTEDNEDGLATTTVSENQLKNELAEGSTSTILPTTSVKEKTESKPTEKKLEIKT